MVPRDPNMAEQDRRAADGDAEYTPAQVQSPERTGTDTRRTSVSSAGVRSDPSRTAEMQASYTSAQSEGQRSRPRPSRLDYGMLAGKCGRGEAVLIRVCRVHAEREPTTSPTGRRAGVVTAELASAAKTWGGSPRAFIRASTSRRGVLDGR